MDLSPKDLTLFPRPVCSTSVKSQRSGSLPGGSLSAFSASQSLVTWILTINLLGNLPWELTGRQMGETRRATSRTGRRRFILTPSSPAVGL